MREAAVSGGLVPNTPKGRERIEFVTEGEASFHWCIEQSIAGSALKEGASIVVADLGGGTIDVSSFLVKTSKPLRLQEKLAPEYRLQGTPFDDEEYIETLREEFDENTKCLFRDEPDQAVYIKIGRRRDHFENLLCRIKNGMLEIQREDIEEAFEPSITATVNAIYKHISGQRDAVGLLRTQLIARGFTHHLPAAEVQHVFLVGGFAASPWVLSETKRHLKSLGVTNEVKRADSNTAKAVAHGGVAFYLDRFVAERIMRYTYGVGTQPSYNPSNPEHAARAHKLEMDHVSGITYVQGGFSTLVKKVVSRAFDSVGWFECEIPASALTKRTGKYGTYWAVNYEVVITLGTVEIKCHIEWEENGEKKR
ncbi:hypothetical protein FRC00_000351 [Tulasnella sp. 408]|nr:hypothetical protein FRC00_000351 [Tulasnella sp. 408]